MTLLIEDEDVRTIPMELAIRLAALTSQVEELTEAVRTDGDNAAEQLNDLRALVDEGTWAILDTVRDWTSPRTVARALLERRTWCYELFGTQSEEFKGEERIARAERDLRALADSPVHVSQLHRNLAEYEAWACLMRPMPEGRQRTKEELLEAAHLVLATASDEGVAREHLPIYEVLASDPEKRRYLHMMHIRK